jgi:hypothetical protein
MRIRAKEKLFGLTVGKEYEVIGLDDQYYRVLDDSGEPVLFPHTAFVVLDEQVPPDWVWQRYAEGDFYANPPELQGPGFYEDYFDHKRYAQEAFAVYLRRVGLHRNRGG